MSMDAAGWDEDEPEAVEGKRSPLRRCIVTGEVKAKDGLVRFVVGPDGSAVPDLEERLPGRGHWVTAERELVRKAVAKGAFSRVARRPVRAEADLADRVEALLKTRCLDLLGMARRGGQVVSGFEKVREALKAGEAGLLLAASDGAEDGKAKLRALAIHAAPGAALVEVFGAAEMGSALGRDIAVHACLAPGRMAKRFLAECRRYAGFAGARIETISPVQVAGQRDETAEQSDRDDGP
jgi:predicted RNA-binding protein YlxR (DUF448 family)